VPEAGQGHVAQQVRRVRNHCVHNHAARTALVSITYQHAWMCARAHTVYDTAVTTGRAGSHTPTGRFRIEGHARNTVLRPDEGGAYHVRYWIPFQGPAYGFHDAHWQRFPFGSAAYRTAGSHGCVHMPISAMRFLYRWGRVGTVVRIRG
jgi:lipoprotein-anchoring transpeptidase ErfK/SrfK